MGDVKDFGSRICQLHSLADGKCPYEVSSSNWRYWTGSEFKNVNSGEMIVLCQGGQVPVKPKIPNHINRHYNTIVTGTAEQMGPWGTCPT